MASALLRESVAAFTFAHRDSLYNRGASEKVLKHRSEALRMINDNLGSGVVEDATIMAVCQMFLTSLTLASASVSTLFCHDFSHAFCLCFSAYVPYKGQHTLEYLNEVEVHMNGVETLVKIRGGISELGSNGAVSELVCW
jgi:hypothetical protein